MSDYDLEEKEEEFSEVAPEASFAEYDPTGEAVPEYEDEQGPEPIEEEEDVARDRVMAPIPTLVFDLVSTFLVEHQLTSRRAVAEVFDEVDEGVGGAVADAVGERLARLARDVQVLVVTHSPQVAARGGRHIRVFKQTAKNSARAEIETLDGDARQEEIARMLSGAEITDEARAAAQSLIASGPA